MIRGSVDIVNTKQATGWIFSDKQKDPLTVEAVLHHRCIGRVTANLPRPDLAKAGFGSGQCGFELAFDTEIDPLYLPFVKVRLSDSDLELPRWSGAGFAEYFTALYERYPRAGRSGSVYGSLWIDRTDAASLLKGRTDTGAIMPPDANAVAQLIHEGIWVANQADLSTKHTYGEDLPSLVAHALFDDGLLRVLRHVLDDQPVAVKAELVHAPDAEFQQSSVLEESMSPAECLGIVFPASESPLEVQVVRGGHRLPEFAANGVSRWTNASAGSNVLSAAANLTLDRYVVHAGNAAVISAGAFFRLSGQAVNALRVLVLPARLCSLKQQKTPPRGEVTHASGARVWV